MRGVPEQPEADADLLSPVLSATPPPFALICRTEADGSRAVDVLLGIPEFPGTLSGIALPEPSQSSDASHHALVLVPYRQLTERGFACRDDGSPLIAITVTAQQRLLMPDVLTRIPDAPLRLAGGRFDVSDDEYADLVRRIVGEQIATGAGANFVLKRSFTADITDYSPASALTLFRRLLLRETGAYWTFVVHTGTRTFVGATPERHISVSGGLAVMNPISGTYRYPSTGPTLSGVMDFLADVKESDELYMVVDEELKMMARLCDAGGRVVGPYLREMASLAHTEYFIEGSTCRDPRQILRETMFAPTVTGSPLESASRVIAQYEPRGRGYYSGVIALIGQDAQGQRTLDSAILIRTAEIDADGRLDLGVGATLVRHSDPVSEVAETKAKAAGLLAAFENPEPVRLREHPQVLAALARRNVGISRFWLGEPTDTEPEEPLSLSILIVDAEDTFTQMIAHQLRGLGARVDVCRYDEQSLPENYDLVVLGPGPGDPRDLDDPRIATMHRLLATMLAGHQPFVAVCLSHQVLCLALGLQIRRLPAPNQGVQRAIELFGTVQRVGFYNAFAAHAVSDRLETRQFAAVEVSRNFETGEVYALRGGHFASMQFHAESVLTEDGPAILRGVLNRLLLRVPVA